MKLFKILIAVAAIIFCSISIVLTVVSATQNSQNEIGTILFFIGMGLGLLYIFLELFIKKEENK